MKWRSFKRNDKGLSCLLRICYMFLGCAAFMACNREDVNVMSETDGEVEFKLGAGINAISRAVDAGFEIGDTLGLYLAEWRNDTEADTLKPVGNYEDNVRFILLDTDDNWQPEHAVYFPADGRNMDIYAYYPYQAKGISTGTQLDLNIIPDQSTYAAYTYSDFMVAKNVGVKRTPKKVPLVFDHKLSQIVFELIPGEGFTKDDLLGAQVKVINAVTDATFDLAGIMDAVPVAGEKRGDILPFGSWTKTDTSLVGVKAILIPQEINANTYIQLTLGSRRFTFKPSSILLNSGCSRKFSITVNNMGLDISTTINPWDNCPAVNGDAEEEVVADITNGLLFCVPFTDGTARDVIHNLLPTGGYSKDSTGHRFTKGCRYNLNWSIPMAGTFSIMYKFVSKGSTRSFAFGYDDDCYLSRNLSSGRRCMGIWSNIANGGSLSGGNRQYPRGANSEISGMWTDDYHVATFVYDFAEATFNGAEGVSEDGSAWKIYKDGIDVSASTKTMIYPDGTPLSWITIGGGSGDIPDEYTTLYCKDARVYNRRLSEDEVKQLVEYCKAKN